MNRSQHPAGSPEPLRPGHGGLAADEPAPCPLCNEAATPVFTVEEHTVRECGDCDHRFAVPGPRESHLASVYGDSYFFGGGTGYPDYLAQEDQLRAHGARYAALFTRYTEPGRMLDVGCAAGFLMDGFRRAGWQVAGLEPNATMARYGREELGLTIETSSLETASLGEPFDLISLIQVLGHFHDLRGAISQASAMVKTEGLMLIETWRRDSWPARLCGRYWHEYSPPSVLHWFSRAGLDRLMDAYGFAPLAEGRPAKYISGRHAKALLRHKFDRMPLGRIVKPALRLLPERAQLFYPAFDLEWILYRKSGDAPIDVRR
jgi:SAM-dependent methyltransferase